MKQFSTIKVKKQASTGCGWLLHLPPFPQLCHHFWQLCHGCVLWLWLVVAVAALFPTFASSSPCICMVISCGCIIVASWLLQPLCIAVAVVLGCCGWSSFPIVASSFPTVVSWLLHSCCILQLWFVVVVATIFMHAFGAVVLIVVGCCWLLWLMILVFPVASHGSVVVSLAPVCVQFHLANCFCCCQPCCFCHALHFRILATVC